MKISLKKLGIVMLIVFLGIAMGQLAFAKDKGFVIGLSQPNMEHPYRVGGTNKAKAWAEAHKDLIAELILVDGRRNSAVQLDALEDLLVRGVDAIVMSPNDSDALAPIGESAKRKGIPIIAFDRKLNVPDDQIAAFVGGDNVEMGRVAGRYIAEKLGGKGKVIQLEGTPGASATVDRKAGFEEIMAKYPDIKVVSFVGHYRRHEAVAAMEDAVVANPDVQAVYAHNDSMALGGSQVLRERGIKDIIVIGMDGGKEGCDGVASGEITGSVYYPTMFPEALETAVSLLQGKDVSKVTMLETPLITKDNMADICK